MEKVKYYWVVAETTYLDSFGVGEYVIVDQHPFDWAAENCYPSKLI